MNNKEGTWKITDDEDSYEVFVAFTPLVQNLEILSFILAFCVSSYLIYVIFEIGVTGSIYDWGLEIFPNHQFILFCLLFFPYLKLFHFSFFTFTRLMQNFLFKICKISELYNNTKNWRKIVHYQVIGWTDLVNSQFKDCYKWRNYEITFDTVTNEKSIAFDWLMESTICRLNKTFYSAEEYDCRKKWSFDNETHTLKGSINADGIGLIFRIIRFKAIENDLKLTKITFTPTSDLYHLTRYVYEGDGGG